jgi:predicted TIM-barrel fold metal-dependent hydrolase
MIDVFNHILPPDYLAAVDKIATRPPLMFERARQIPAMSNVESRLRLMDEFSAYTQILSLSSPTVDMLSPGAGAISLARAANESLAALCQQHPTQFRGFVATVSMDDPLETCREARRAISELGAVGIQLYTSVNGRPLDGPEFSDVFACMSELQRPIWLHPIRSINVADYPGEKRSKFDLWWALGWPQETSVAMGRLVFAGVFDRWPNLAIITHHVGGSIPMFAGRIESGLSVLGTRNSPEDAWTSETSLKEPPLHAFKRFYADTASFGSRAALDCGREFFGLSQMLFASDMPFDPEQGRGYIRDTIRAIREMQLDDSERSTLFEGNIKRLLRWD